MKLLASARILKKYGSEERNERKERKRLINMQ